MNKFSSPKKIAVVLLFAVVLLHKPIYAVFIISGENNCFGSDTYKYYFSETAIIADFTVKVRKDALLPDITMKLVNDPKQADLIFVDGFSQANMKVCKISIPVGVKSIKLSDTALLPDITVRLSETAILADYKIFILSAVFTKEEAAALFAVIWKSSRNR